MPATHTSTPRSTSASDAVAQSSATAGVPDFLGNSGEVIFNPSNEVLRTLVEAMPTARVTEFGNMRVETEVLARSKASTYIITDNPSEHTDQTISVAEGARMAALQDAHMANATMVVIDGCIGPDNGQGTPVRMMIEKSHANIAAMQRQLYFTPQADKAFVPEFHVIYTPNLKAEGYPKDRLISVDLENNVTRVFNSDYFGESKKGGLRMWNKRIHDLGGLPMHAGCKEIPVGPAEKGEQKVGVIIGLSGTGKTTTTFSQQNGSKPIQDDFIALLPSGQVLATENGCFAKTYGLDAASEPVIHQAVTRPEAYLENVSLDAEGKANFFDDSYTQNGRATFPFDLIENAGDPSAHRTVDFVLILNRNENIIPAVAKLTQAQAAAYFMLGETQGTSAGGAEEAGKALRVPGTNPFFPLLHAEQGTRFLELLRKLPVNVYLMNTGWVGGADGTEHSKKVKIRHSSAIVKGIAEETITWKDDADFGYQVASEVPGLEAADQDILCPQDYYAKTGRSDVYARMVNTLKTDRRAHLEGYEGLSEEIVAAVD